MADALAVMASSPADYERLGLSPCGVHKLGPARKCITFRCAVRVCGTPQQRNNEPTR